MKISGIEEKYTNTGKYMICYFDLLGTKNKIATDEKEAFTNLWFINYTLKKCSYNRKDAIIRTFSDNYFIALSIGENINETFSDLINIVGNVYAEVMVNINMLMRGYVTAGEMHIDEDTIIGVPLVKAYKYESEIIKYPRICIDINLIGVNDKNIYNYKESIYTDSDLMPCINVLKFIDQNYLCAFKNNFSNSIIEGANKSSGSELVKNLWVINYINGYFRQNYGYEIIDVKSLEVYDN